MSESQSLCPARWWTHSQLLVGWFSCCCFSETCWVHVGMARVFEETKAVFIGAKLSLKSHADWKVDSSCCWNWPCLVAQNEAVEAWDGQDFLGEWVAQNALRLPCFGWKSHHPHAGSKMVGPGWMKEGPWQMVEIRDCTRGLRFFRMNFWRELSKRSSRQRPLLNVYLNHLTNTVQTRYVMRNKALRCEAPWTCRITHNEVSITFVSNE